MSPRCLGSCHDHGCGRARDPATAPPSKDKQNPFRSRTLGIVSLSTSIDFPTTLAVMEDVPVMLAPGRGQRVRPMWRPDSPAMPSGDHDGLAAVTPLTGTRSIFTSCSPFVFGGGSQSDMVPERIKILTRGRKLEFIARTRHPLKRVRSKR
jgi:hypothetical protein